MFTIRVKEGEKALVYKEERLVKVFGPGVHKGFFPKRKYTMTYYETKCYGIGGERATLLAKRYPELIKEHFTVIRLQTNERAYISIDGMFVELLEAGATKLYWKEYEVAVEKVNVERTYAVAKNHLQYLKRSTTVKAMHRVAVDKNFKGYLYVDEVFVQVLESGQYAFYTDYYAIDVKMVETRIQEIEVTGQELLSADKVTLRCNVTMHYAIENGVLFLRATEVPEMYMYKQLQFAIRDHFGAMCIDEVLQRQHTLGTDVLEQFYERCRDIGVRVEGVHIKDIILPGEMRDIFNRVIEATKRAEANNIQRREETAATRSLLNTAKLMNDNPALIRLKELEALEKITHTVGTLNVYGGLENVMHGLVDLKGK